MPHAVHALSSSPCLTQCTAARRVDDPEHLRRCVCRACNHSATREAWGLLLTECGPTPSALGRELGQLCAQLSPLCHGIASVA